MKDFPFAISMGSSGSGLEPVGPPNRGFPKIKRAIMGGP